MSLAPDLREAAKKAFENAYAPYSHYHVGAAILTENDTIYFGCNVENASYGLTRCAEQSAVQTMVSNGDRDIKTIYIYSNSEPPASPCGACRQILFEFGPDCLVILGNHLGSELTFKLSDLIPGAFGPKNLKEK